MRFTYQDSIQVCLFFPILALGFLLAIPSGTLAADNCRAQPRFVSSGSAGRDDDNFKDADLVGGNENILKIIKIEVFTVPSGKGDSVVTNLCTTYTSAPAPIPIPYPVVTGCTGNTRGELQGVIEIPDGVYLSKIDLREGNICIPGGSLCGDAEVDDVVVTYWLSFALTDGRSFGPWGYQRSEPPTRSLGQNDAVIHSFFGKSDDYYIYHLGAIYEQDRIYDTRLETLEFLEVRPPTVTEDLPFTSPAASLTVDNRRGTGTRSSTVNFEETISTSETYTVTETSGSFSEVSISSGVKFDISLVGSSFVETSFTVGTAFSQSLEQSSTARIDRTISRSYTIEAPPRRQVTGTMFYRQVEYEYEWEGPVICSYTYAPDDEIVDQNALIRGTLAGSQPFPEAYIVLTEDGDGTGGDTDGGDGTGGDTGSDNASCFSGETLVTVQNKGLLKMKDLMVNDQVYTGSDGRGNPKYQSIYSFGHLDRSTPVEYIRIYATKNDNPIELTPAHLIFLADTQDPVRAGAVKAGDKLVLAKSDTNAMEHAVVTKVDSVTRTGAFLPLTPDGTIVVNNLVASTYVSIDHNTPDIINHFSWLVMSQHNLLHWWLAPYRMVCMGISPQLCQNDFAEDGIVHWLHVGENLALFGEKQHSWVQRAGVGIITAAMFVLVVIEYIFTPKFGAMGFTLVAVMISCIWKRCRSASIKNKKKALLNSNSCRRCWKCRVMLKCCSGEAAKKRHSSKSVVEEGYSAD
jgi:hypothetical protein